MFVSSSFVNSVAASRRALGSAALAANLLLACGGSAAIDSNSRGGASATAGAASSIAGAAASTAGAAGLADSMGGAAGLAQECTHGLATPEQIAATPRADTNLELLALRLSSDVVAEQAIYDRVVRDVGAIRAQEPSLAGIGYSAPNDGKALLLSVDSATLSAMRADTYPAWECLNREYGLLGEALSPSASLGYVTLELKGIYDLTRVAAQYAPLPGVKAADPNQRVGDGSTICVTREADVWHYVFDAASGDCLAGCTEHAYRHFTTSDAGTVVALGELSPALVSRYASAQACR